MKAKALLFVGLLAGGSALAQTVSQNIVGYVNVTVPAQVGGAARYVMIANPLKATPSNKASDVIKLGATDDLVLFHFGAAGFTSTVFSGGEALDGGDVVLNPGGGFFAASGSAAPVKITFIGEVDIAGAVAGHTVPAGLSIQSSVLPKAGALADLEYPLGSGDNDGDETFQFINNNYVGGASSAGSWLSPGDKGPSVGVAEAFWVKRSGAVGNWKQPSASALLN